MEAFSQTNEVNGFILFEYTVEALCVKALNFI